MCLDFLHHLYGPEYRSQYSDPLRAGRSRDQIPVGARFSALVQTGPGAKPAFYAMGTGPFLEGKAAGVWRQPLTRI